MLKQYIYHYALTIAKELGLTHKVSELALINITEQSLAKFVNHNV